LTQRRTDTESPKPFNDIDLANAKSRLPYIRASKPATEVHLMQDFNPEIRTEQVVYSEREGTVLAGTLFRPANSKNCPVVIAVHGGGWKQGSPQRYGHWGKWFASRGIALYAIQYRLADQPKNRFPAPALDVIAAIDFIWRSHQDLGLDADRIALMGDSAGAHLVSWVALAGHSLRADASADRTAPLPKLCAVIAVYGVFDLLGQWEHDQIARPRDHVTEALMGFSLPEDRLAYFHASPIAHATTKAPRRSFLVAWGTNDDIVDWASQSGHFVTALRQSGQYVRTVPVVGASHLWIDQPLDEDRSYTGFLAPKVHRFLLDRFANASGR
jgi:acetyl esterase/lipase